MNTSDIVVAWWALAVVALMLVSLYRIVAV